MARDGSVGNVGQTQLAEEAALFLFRRLAALGEGQKTFERQFQSLCAANFGLQRFADQRRASTQHRDFDAFQIRIVEQLLFRRRTLPPQTAALADGELGVELGFHQPGQREIEIVAAQQQVLPTAVRVKFTRSPSRVTRIEAEITGAAADVAHQDHLAR